MRLPQPRLTIGRLMALVAVLALVLGLAVLVSRWNYCRRQAERHEEIAGVLRSEVAAFERMGEPAQAEMRGSALVEEEREARRFRAAQRRPWLAVPDEAP